MTESSNDRDRGVAPAIDFRQLVNLASDPIIVHDGTRIVYANPAAAALVGAPSPDSLLGKPIIGFVAPEFRASVAERARELSEHGGALGGNERVFVRLDGSRVEVETTGVALGDGRTLVVVRDVSRRAQAERAQAFAESRLRAFFEVTQDAVGLADGRTGAHILVNAAHARIFGFQRPEDEEGTVVMDRIAPSERQRVGDLARRLLTGELRALDYTTRGLRLDGTEFPLEIAVTTFTEGSRVILAAMMRDITERNRAEAERNALQERLRQSEKLEAVGRLAGGIAHDFNNILSGILGYTELTLLGLDRSSELHDHQQRIREATLRARDLVRQILAFSRRESPNRRVVDVPTVVTEALTLMRAAIPASVTVEARIDPGAGATLADPTQIHQVVLNLASNARDAVSSYGRIEIAVEPLRLGGEVPGLPAGRYVRLRVRDDGTGMDEATQARLFEPYMTTKGRSGGHGLGLAVVHAIVAAAGGAIQVESAPGRGSTFDVYLPRSELSAAGEPVPTHQAEGDGERILVVDDEPLVRNAHRRLLESLGYAVEVAADGEEALARFREAPESFDLVLTDQSMPRLEGTDLARALLAIRPELPVILCTGYSDDVDETSARRLGLRSLLTKPIDRATMGATLRAALRKD